jgi:hypothetical protein
MVCGFPANRFFSSDATPIEKLTYAIITVLLAAVRGVDWPVQPGSITPLSTPCCS